MLGIGMGCHGIGNENGGIFPIGSLDVVLVLVDVD